MARERVTVSTYIKNVGKSFGYAVEDTFKEYNPVISSIHKQVKDTKSEIYETIKDFKSPDVEGGKSLIGDLKATGNDIWNNFKSDVRTGKFYNKERAKGSDEAMAKMLGFDMSDFEMDFDDDWGDDWDDEDSNSSSEAEISSGVKNTQALIGTMDTVGAQVANTVAGATVESASYLAKNSNNNTRALYNLNQKGFNAMSTALLSVNNTIASFAKIGEPLSTHMQNSSVFFTKTTETLNQMNQTLQQIAKNTTPAMDTTNANSKAAKHTLGSIMDDGVISIDAYKDMIKENFSDYKDIVDMAVNGIKGLKSEDGSYGKNISIGTFVTKYITNAMIPAVLKNSMKGFNEAIKNSMTRGILGLKNYNSGNIIVELLKDFFVPEDGYKSKINTANYEKGRVSWDGISRKALTEVIPEYLSGIYRVLSGEDKVYDYNRGKFITRGYVKQELENEQKRYAKEAGGDFREDALNKISSNDKLSAKDKKRMEKEVENYFYKAFTENDGFYINSDEFDAKKFGINKDTKQLLQDLLEEYRKKENIENIGKGSGLAARIDEQRTEYGDKKRREEATGTSNEVYTENGFRDLSKGLGIGTDKLDGTLMGYVSGIYENTKFMADNMNTFGNSKKKNRKKNHKGQKTYDQARTDKSESIIEEDEFKEIEDEDEDSIRKKEKEDNIKELKDRINDTKKNGILSRLKGFFKKDHLLKMYNRPFEAVANLLNGLTVSMDKLLWGDDKVGDENGEHGIFGYLWKQTKSVFNKINDYIDKKFKFNIKDRAKKFWNSLWGEKDENGKRQGGKFGELREETTDELKNAGKWFLGKNKKDINSDESAEPDQAAYGRKVTRDGIVSVSKGELIIPSELNPYYHGTTNKKRQIRNERNNIRKFFGMFAEGGTVGEEDKTPKDGEGKTEETKVDTLANDFKGFLKEKGGDVLGIVRQGFNEALWGREKDANDPNDFDRKGLVAFMQEATGKSNDENDRKVIQEQTKSMLEEAGDNKGAIAAGALIGGGVSILTGAVVGPLFGAAIGGATGMLVRSKKAQDWLFGKEDEKGNRQGGKIKNKKVIDFITKNVPSMAKGGGIGLVGGAFMGSPILGAIIGSTIGYVSSSEKSKNWLFGTAEKDEKGNITGRKDNGVISQDLQKKIKSAAPKAALGAIIGAAAGPFGLVGNMIFGAGLGYLSDSKSFHEYLFGDGKDDKGLAGMIKTKIVDQLDELFHNTGIAMNQWLKNTGRTLKNKLFDLVSRRKKAYNNGDRSLLTRLIGGTASVGDKVVKGTIGKVGEGIGALNRRRKAKNLAKGYNVYNKEEKRNAIAEERVKMRGENASGTAYELDKLMANSNKKDLENLRDLVQQIQDPNRAAKKKVDQTFNNLYSDFADSNIDKSVAKQIGRRIDSENGESNAIKVINNSNLSSDQKKKAIEIVKKRSQELKSARDLQVNQNAAVELMKTKYGIDLDGNNAYNALDNINYELKTRYSGENGEKNETKEYRSKVTELLDSINTNIENYMGIKDNKKKSAGATSTEIDENGEIHHYVQKPDISGRAKGESQETKKVEVSEDEFNKAVEENKTNTEKAKDAFYTGKDKVTDFAKGAAEGAGWMTKTGVKIAGKVLPLPFKIPGVVKKAINPIKTSWQNTRGTVSDNEFYGGYNTGGISGFFKKKYQGLKRTGRRLRNMNQLYNQTFYPGYNYDIIDGQPDENLVAVSEGEQIVDSKAEGGIPGEQESFMDKLSNKILDKSNGGSLFGKVKEWKNNRAEKKAQKADTRSAMQKLGDKFSKIKERVSNARKSKNKSSSSDDSDGDGDFISPTMGSTIVAAATGKSSGNAGSGGSDSTGDGDKDPNTKTEIDAFGNIHRMVKNNDGQWTEANNDSDTNESKSKMNSFFSSVNTVPEMAMILSSINATLSQIAANGLGGKKKKKSNLFKSLFSKLFGGAKSALGLLSGKLGGLLGKIPAKDLIGPALLVAALGGLFDKSANKLSKGAYGDKNQEKVLYTKDGKKVTKITKNGKSYYVDENGNKVNYDDLHYETGDTKSLSSKLKENIGRGIVTGRSSIGSKVLKNNKTIKTAGKAVKKVATKAANKIADSGALSIAKDKLTSGVGKLIKALKKVPGLKGVADKLDDMGTALIQKVSDKLANTSAKKLSEAAGKVFVLTRIAFVAIDFTSGYEDARTTLGITDEPTYAQKMISGLLRVIKNCIPIVGTFIPDSMVVNILCDTIGPKLGISFKTLKKQRTKADKEVKKYNKKHGTNLTKQQYTKQVLKDKTWTERTSDAITNTKKDAKKKWNNLKKGVKEKGVLGYAKDSAKNLGKTFMSSYKQEGGGVIGIDKGLNDTFAKILPGVLGEIQTVSGKIKSDANKGDLKAMWKESLSDFSGGKKNGDVTTATPGIFSNIIGNIPLFLTKVTYSPLALFKATFNKIGDAFKSFFSPITNNMKAFESGMKSIKKKAKDGDVSGVTKTKIKTKGFIGGLFKMMFGIARGIYTLKAGVNKLLKPLNSLKEKIFGSGDSNDSDGGSGSSNSGGILSSIGQKVSSGVTAVGTTLKGAASKASSTFKNLFFGTSDNDDKKDGKSKDGKKDSKDKNNKSKTTKKKDTKNTTTKKKTTSKKSKKKSGGGSGLSGFVSQYNPNFNKYTVSGESFADKGCGPAVASMAASQFGKKLSVSDAVRSSRKYQNENGVSIDYFKDVLGKKNINTELISGGSSGQIAQRLANGGKAILLGNDPNNQTKDNSPFGPDNHYVLATGMDQDGNILVNDPESGEPRKYSSDILNHTEMAIDASGGASGTKKKSKSDSKKKDTKKKDSSKKDSKSKKKGSKKKDSSDSTTTEDPKFPTYKLSNAQIKGIANIVGHEQSGKAGRLAEASLIVNRTDISGKKKTPSDIVKTVTGGWFADGKNRYNNPGSPGKTAINAVKEVIVNGKRTLPRYVDEHDCFSDIGSVTTDGKSVSKTNRKAYKSHKTTVKNHMGSTYTFYSFPDKASDPFGYTSKANRKKWGDAHYEGDQVVGSLGSGTDESGSDSSSSSGKSATILESIGNAFTSGFAKVFGGGDDSSSGSSDNGDAGSTSAEGKGTAESFVNIAKSQIGTKESPAGSNHVKYNKWYYGSQSGNPWCAAFVSWCMNETFNGDTKTMKKVFRGPKAAAVSVLYDRFRKAKAFTKTDPQPGDIVIYKNGTSHTGLVEKVKGKKVTTIEGNTSARGFNANGGMVAEKHITVGQPTRLTGFGRPNWDAAGGKGASTDSSSKKKSKSDSKKKENSKKTETKKKTNTKKTESKKTMKKKSGGSSGLSTPAKLLNQFSPSKVLYNREPLEGVTLSKPNMRMTINNARLSGGDSGITEQTTSMLNDIKRSISENNTSGSIDSKVVEKLITAITGLLQSIASNTAPVQLIYDLLNSYLGNKNSTTNNSESATTQTQNNMTNKEVDENVKNLVGALAAIAKG